MYVGFKNHKSESLKKLLSSLGILVFLLLTSCAERPPNAYDSDNIPPTVTIISPAAVEVENTAKNDIVKTSKKTSEVPREGKSIGVRPGEIPGIKKKDTGNQVVQRNENSGAVYKKGVELVFVGHAEDVEEDSLSEASLRWTCDVDGEIGRGYSFTKSDLSAGEHQIVLYATDSEGGVGRDTVHITISDQTEVLKNKLPVAEILSISGIDFLEGGISLNLQEIGEVILNGRGTDEEDGTLGGESLIWISSIDGKLGTGSSLDATDLLSPGNHTITLTVTDSKGAADSESVNVSVENVIEETINKLPVAEILSVAGITSLSDGISLNLLDIGNHLILEGRGTDEEDGPLEGESLEWSSDSGMILGTKTGATPEIPRSDLTPGDHTITLTVTDSEEAVAEDHVNISILDPVPSAPTGLVFEALSSHGIQLSWVDNSDNETGFVIEQSLNGEILGYTRTDVNTSSKLFNDLAEGIYSFRVAAENSYGSSDFSNSVELNIPLQITNLVTEDYTIGFTVDSTNVLTVGDLDGSLHFGALRFDNLLSEIKGRNVGKAELYLELAPSSSFETQKTFSVDAIKNSWENPVILTDVLSLAGLSKTFQMTSSISEQQAVFDITEIVQKWANGDLNNNGLVVQMERELTSILAPVYFESLETSRGKNTPQLAPQIIVDFEN